jgi:tetratricopeptide (TPR) repeat protein
LGYNQKALDSLSRAIEQESNFAHIWVNLGIAYEKLENWKDALECYLRAAELNPLLLDLNIWTTSSHLYAFQEDVSSLYRGLSWHINYCSKQLGQV